MRSIRLMAVLAAGALAAGTFACSSGDGNEGVLDVRPQTVTFTPLEQNVGPHVALREGNANIKGVLRVEVWAAAVTDLWSVAFTLEYDPSVLRFVQGSAANGGFLGNADETEVLAEPEPGRDDRVVVGASRLSQGAGDTGMSGTGRVLTLDFEVLGNGTSDLDFAPPPANTAAQDSMGGLLFGEASFFGATVTVE